VFAYSYEGKRYDCGSKIGFLEATVAFALKHPELAGEFQQLVNDAAEPRTPDSTVADAPNRAARHLTLVSS
jgi:UTP--glucose-1-phosphate uridylyltransferase